MPCAVEVVNVTGDRRLDVVPFTVAGRGVRKRLEFRVGRGYLDRVTRRFRDSLARHGTSSPTVRAALTLLVLVILVIPALDLAWNETKAAERPGARCPLHANPVAVGCPLAIDTGQESQPGDVIGARLRPQLVDTSIFVPPKL